MSGGNIDDDSRETGNDSSNNRLDALPAHLNASDFTLINSTLETTRMFQMMLDRVQASDPAGTAVIKAMWLEGGRVVMNQFDGVVVPGSVWSEIQEVMKIHPGQDLWDARTQAVYWNPYSALQVADKSGKIIGVQSPAEAFVHESAHAIDPLSIIHIQDEIPDYKNLGEYLALRYEQMSSQNLGEVIRENHHGFDLLVDNPNVRTAVVDGQTVWIKTNENGQIEIGPKYDFKKINPNWDVPGQGPKFGSQDPGHAAENNHPSPHDQGSGGGSPRNDEPREENHDDPYTGRHGDNGTGIAGYDENGNPIYNPPVPSEGDVQHPWDEPPSSGNGGSGRDDGCVHVASFLPDGRLAGDIRVGDTMELGDEETLQPATGEVTYSKTKTALGYRIITESGVRLVCSDTAPIPVKGKGLLTPDKLLGELVAVQRDLGIGQHEGGWERVQSVEQVGQIKVQHITVGNKCFWAGEDNGAYILHHNLKQAGGNQDDNPEDWDDPLKAQKPNDHQSLLATQQHAEGRIDEAVSPNLAVPSSNLETSPASSPNAVNPLERRQSVPGTFMGNGPATHLDGHLVLPDGSTAAQVPSFETGGFSGPWHVHAVYSSTATAVTPPSDHGWSDLNVPPLVPAAVLEEHLGNRKDAFLSDVGNDFADAGALPAHFSATGMQKHGMTAPPKLGEVPLSQGDGIGSVGGHSLGDHSLIKLR